jgi:hypothetical protein
VDQDGFVIPKAEINLTKKFTQKTIAGVTGPAGEWNQPKIATGQYLITVKSKGFPTFSIAIEVHNGTLLGLKIKLPVAEANVTVEVKAEPVVVMGTTVGIVMGSPIPLRPVNPGGQRSPMNP